MGKNEIRNDGNESSANQSAVKDLADKKTAQNVSDVKEERDIRFYYEKIKTYILDLLSKLKELGGSKNNELIPLGFFLGLIIYLEFVLHLSLFRSIDDKIIYPIIFAVPAAVLCTIITGLFSKIWNQILFWAITLLTCLLFATQLIYYDLFKVFFSFQSMGMAGDAFSEFGTDILTAIRENIFGLLLVFLPLPILGELMRKIPLANKRGYKIQGILIASNVIIYVLALGSLLIYGKGDYSPFDLYHKSKVHDLCGKQLGIITMTRFDIRGLIFDEDDLVLVDADTIEWEVEKSVTPVPTPLPTPIVKRDDGDGKNKPSQPTPTLSPTPTPIDRSPNVLNIDFGALAQLEKDESIRTMHQYFANVEPTNKNQYTGMFEGYNLIMITAEGFSPYAVHKEKTPTLYRLTNEGFIFKNFYTPLWQTSTSDGEFVAMTGLIPVGTRSMYHSRNNYMPFVLGHQFNKLGVASKAYHNHTYTYYQRDQTHPNLGYIYKGVGNGLVLEHDVWPNSDLEMIQATVDEYIKEDQFHVYYLTVSGHMNYSFIGNSMSNKNKHLVADLDYSSSCRAYIACQMELDKALEELIKRLEEAGVADRTVIALSADHYPYGWEKENLDELAGRLLDPNFEIYRNHFILWSAGMKENIVVEEPCSSLDILPTLSNLFGIEYDSRLLMGRDIFSDADPLVIFNNRSFITDKVMYNAETGEVIQLTKEELPENYITTMNKRIKNKFAISKSIIEKDYYGHIFK